MGATCLGVGTVERLDAYEGLKVQAKPHRIVRPCTNSVTEDLVAPTDFSWFRNPFKCRFIPTIVVKMLKEKWNGRY
jgi:hypothetical protein